MVGVKGAISDDGALSVRLSPISRLYLHSAEGVCLT